MPSRETKHDHVHWGGDLTQQCVVDDQARTQAEIGAKQQGRAELPVAAANEEHRGGEQAAQPGEPGQDVLLARRTIGHGTHDGQHHGGADRRHRHHVEHQGAGRDAESEHPKVDVARLVGGSRCSARCGFRHRDEVRREQHGGDRRRIGRVCPVVEVPGSVFVTTCPGRIVHNTGRAWSSSYGHRLGPFHTPRAWKTSRSKSMRSLMIASTPWSKSAHI